MNITFSISSESVDHIQNNYNGDGDIGEFLKLIPKMIKKENNQGNEVLIQTSTEIFTPRTLYIGKIFYEFSMIVDFEEIQVDTVPDIIPEWCNSDSLFHFPCPIEIAENLKGGEKLSTFTTEKECLEYLLYSTSLPKFNIDDLQSINIYVLNENFEHIKVGQIYQKEK